MERSNPQTTNRAPEGSHRKRYQPRLRGADALRQRHDGGHDCTQRSFAKKKLEERREYLRTHCAVCGAAVYDADGALIREPKFKVEVVGATTVILCGRHERVGSTMTLSGHVRYHELPPEAAQ
jgi:hypothetical protein